MFTQKYTKILEATSYHEDPKENPLMRTRELLTELEQDFAQSIVMSLELWAA